jgi:hypothetical protein
MTSPDPHTPDDTAKDGKVIETASLIAHGIVDAALDGVGAVIARTRKVVQDVRDLDTTDEKKDPATPE